MAVYPEGSTPLLPALAGLASAYYNVKNQMQQSRIEQQRANIEQQEAPYDIAYKKAQTAGIEQQYGLDQSGNPLPRPQYAAPPAGKAGDFKAMYQFAMQNAYQAYLKNDPRGAAYWNGAAASYQKMYEDSGLTNYHQAEAQYIGGPKTQLTEAQVKNTINLFPHQIDMLRMRGANAEQVARIHAAYRRAGGGRASNTAEQEQRAEYAAINMAAREGVDAQNLQQNSIYRYESELHASDPTKYPDQPQVPQMMPIPVYIPGPSGGPPTVIMVQPNGQIAPASQPSAHRSYSSVPSRAPKSGVPSGPPPRRASSSGGFNPLQAAEDWWHAHFGGGGTPQHLSATSHGKPIHSDDGGRTWKPGP